MAGLDVSEVFGWLVVVVVLVSLPLLCLDPGGARRRLGPRALALVERAVEHVRPVDEPDPLAEALRAQIRRERLVADVARLRRIVATDEHMSAVRQIGNRMAYGQLLLELEALRDVPPVYTFATLGALGAVGALAASSVPDARWRDDLALPVGPALSPRFQERDGQRAPAVEVLELGPRRRLAR